jgi:hypothetical protein
VISHRTRLTRPDLRAFATLLAGFAWPDGARSTLSARQTVLTRRALHRIRTDYWILTPLTWQARGHNRTSKIGRETSLVLSTLHLAPLLCITLLTLLLVQPILLFTLLLLLLLVQSFLLLLFLFFLLSLFG